MGEMEDLKQEEMISDYQNNLVYEGIVEDYGKDSDEYKEAYGEDEK